MGEREAGCYPPVMFFQSADEHRPKPSVFPHAPACRQAGCRVDSVSGSDRDSKFTDQSCRLVREAETEVIRLPPTSPNANAYAERFVRSIKEECLNPMICIGQASLRNGPF